MSEPAVGRASAACYAVVMLTIANAFAFVDRQALALLVQPIQDDLHASVPVAGGVVASLLNRRGVRRANLLTALAGFIVLIPLTIGCPTRRLGSRVIGSHRRHELLRCL